MKIKKVTIAAEKICAPRNSAHEKGEQKRDFGRTVANIRTTAKTSVE
jgi:hypothetical protein